MNSVAHIINPFKASFDSDLYRVQPISFESILRAKTKADSIMNVELLSAQFEEDAEFVPLNFKKTTHLSRSVLDVHPFNSKHKLPFIADILERLYHESDAEYLIYTNVDIGLYEDFYLKVNQFINSGLDAFIINRRRLPNKYSEVNQLHEIYADKGKPHPGFDCFVFHRNLYPKLLLQGICIGVPFFEISFSQNLFAFGRNFKLFEHEYLTFHIGEEIFKKRMPSEYYDYNKAQFWKICDKLLPHMHLNSIPYSEMMFPVRAVKWVTHPCFPIRLMLKLELKRLKFL